VILKRKFRKSWDQIPLDSDFLFIHIPKTGGSTLGKALYGDYINHVSARIHQLLDPDRYARMTVFTVVRHPAERFISAINHCIGKSSRAGVQDLGLGKRLLRYGGDAASIAEWLCASPSLLKRVCGASVVFVPQCHWLTDPGGLLLDIEHIHREFIE